MKFIDPKEKHIPYPTSRIIKDIWQNLGSKRSRFIAASFFRVAGDLAGLYPAFALAAVINAITNPHEQIWHTLALIAFFWFIAVTIRYTGLYFAKKIIFHLGIDMWLSVEKNMFAVLVSKDSSWHEQETTGVKMKRIERGAMAYNDILRAWVSNYIEIAIRFIGIPLILLKFDRTVASLVIFFMVTYFIFSKHLLKKGIAAVTEFNMAEENFNGSMIETVSNIRTVKILHVADALAGRISGFIKKVSDAGLKRLTAFQHRSHTMAWYAQMFRILIIMLISYGVLHGRYEVGFLVLFATYFGDIWENIRELTDVSQDMLVSRQSIARMYSLVGREVPKEIGTEAFPSEWKKLHVENLSFSYGENEALLNISFDVLKGEKVGIVGLSGAGKTTLFKLLIRERNDYTGSIKIDDVSIQDITAKEFYNRVSIVPQDTEVFNFPLRDNITLAKQEEADNIALINKAMMISHVKDFLPKLPQGIDTLIGERGIKLSGGERQRLGIARAIFKQPEILLLDEATSHLDLESEEKIKDSLHKFFEGITAIVIAHRLTTIKEMDKIIVIEGGKIIEEGSFEQLMNKKTRFHELWQKQQL